MIKLTMCHFESDSLYTTSRIREGNDLYVSPNAILALEVRLQGGAKATALYVDMAAPFLVKESVDEITQKIVQWRMGK